MKVYWQAETTTPTLSPSASQDWSYLPQSQSIFHHQCPKGKAIKTALLFLSIMRISTRFCEIPTRAMKILGIFPLKCFLTDCLEVSQTLVKLECSFWISVNLFEAEMTKKFKYEGPWTFHIIRWKPSSTLFHTFYQMKWLISRRWKSSFVPTFKRSQYWCAEKHNTPIWGLLYSLIPIPGWKD